MASLAVSATGSGIGGYITARFIGAAVPAVEGRFSQRHVLHRYLSRPRSC